MPEEAKSKKEGASKDVEMKDAEEEKKDSKEKEKEKEEPPKSPRTSLWNPWLSFDSILKVAKLDEPGNTSMSIAYRKLKQQRTNMRRKPNISHIDACLHEISFHSRTILLEAIAQNLKAISAGVTAGDSRVMGRVLRSFAQLRRTMEPEVLKALLEENCMRSIAEHDQLRATFLESISNDIMRNPDHDQTHKREQRSFKTAYVGSEEFGHRMSPQLPLSCLCLSRSSLTQHVPTKHNTSPLCPLLMWR